MGGDARRGAPREARVLILGPPSANLETFRVRGDGAEGHEVEILGEEVRGVVARSLQIERWREAPERPAGTTGFYSSKNYRRLALAEGNESTDAPRRARARERRVAVEDAPKIGGVVVNTLKVDEGDVVEGELVRSGRLRLEGLGVRGGAAAGRWKSAIVRRHAGRGPSRPNARSRTTLMSIGERRRSADLPRPPRATARADRRSASIARVGVGAGGSPRERRANRRNREMRARRGSAGVSQGTRTLGCERA